MSASWGYGTADGPAKWHENYVCAGGERQSPINIDTGKAVYDPALAATPLTITYSPQTNVVIGNTGASFKADCNLDKNATLTGGPLGGSVYRLEQFHMHWGSSNDQGAEHTINDKVYAAELHLVHWNSTAYKSFAEAADKSDGLAVLCMFIKVGSAHEGFKIVARELCKTQCKGDQCPASQPLDPSCLLPGNTQRYWTYPGSLTTPPCYESVQFILFEEVLEFSEEQMKALRSLRFGDAGSPCMENNFRPVCPIGKRTVQASFAQ